MLERELVRTIRHAITWRAGCGGSIGAVLVAAAATAVVDPVAQDAVIGRRVVQDLELADPAARLALAAGLHP